MAVDIDNIRQRLQDPDETFTTEEVNAFVAWEVERATSSSYQLERIAYANAQTDETNARVTQAMQDLLALWDPSPTQPTLEVISYE